MKYSLDLTQSQELEKSLAKVPERAEEIVNKVIHTFGGKAIMESAIHFMPKSKLSKKHAKDSNPLMQVDINLGVKIFEKSAFGYLVFPNDGIGRRQQRKGPQEFMEQGLKAEEETILNSVLIALETASKL